MIFKPYMLFSIINLKESFVLESQQMDVIKEILKHLPVCELKRFSTVSKQWKYVIREILHPALENAMRNKVLCYAHTITKDYEFKADVVSSSANSDVAVVKLLAERINLFHPEEGFELRMHRNLCKIIHTYPIQFTHPLILLWC